MKLDRTTPPSLYPLPSLHLPVAERFTLENGIEIVNIPGGDMPGCRIDFQWPVGVVEADNATAMKLMSASINQGTVNHSSAEIADILDYNGGVLSAQITAHTTRITLYLLNDALPRLLPLVNEIITAPTFPDSEIATLRDNLVAKTRVDLRRVTKVAEIQSRCLLFGENHPQSRVDSPEIIAAITRDDVVKTYRSTIFGVSPTVYISGMTAPILSMIIDTLSEWKVTPARPELIVPMNPAPGRYHAEMPDAQQSAVRIYIPTIDRSRPDYVDLRVAVNALGGYFGSRLMSNIREDKGYTYGINGALYGYREGGVVAIQSEADPRYVNDLIKETFYEIDRLAREPMDEIELQNVRSNEANSLISTLDTPFSVADYIISCDNNRVGDNYYERQMAAATSISAERISQLISRHLDPARAIIQTVGQSIGQPTDFK